MPKPDQQRQVERAHARYVKAQRSVPFERMRLREAVLTWRAEGATIVQVADTLGWSRQSVYDLLGERDERD